MKLLEKLRIKKQKNLANKTEIKFNKNIMQDIQKEMNYKDFNEENSVEEDVLSYPILSASDYEKARKKSYKRLQIAIHDLEDIGILRVSNEQEYIYTYETEELKPFLDSIHGMQESLSELQEVIKDSINYIEYRQSPQYYKDKMARLERLMKITSGEISVKKEREESNKEKEQ